MRVFDFDNTLYDGEMRRALKAYSGKENYHGKEKDQSYYLERIQT